MKTPTQIGMASMGIALAIFAVSGPALPEPIRINFVNTDTTQTIAQLRLCSSEECQTQDALCAPLAKCSSWFDWEKGYWEFAIQGLAEDGTASPMSASGWRHVMSEAERYDRTGDEAVTTIDFPFFLDAFRADQ